MWKNWWIYCKKYAPFKGSSIAILTNSEEKGNLLSQNKGNALKSLFNLLKDYQTIEENLTSQYNQADQAQDYFELLKQITPVHRALKNLHSTLQKAREEISHDRDLIDLRDFAYDLERNFDLLYTDTKNALDFYLAEKAEEQNRLSLEFLRSSDRLNILMAIFLPLTAITSVFGMNLPSGLENAPLIFFWLILSGGIYLGFMMRDWVFKNSLLKNRSDHMKISKKNK